MKTLTVWTSQDIARHFQVSDRQVRRWRSTDLLFPVPLQLPGKTLRWDADQVVAWARGAA